MSGTAGQAGGSSDPSMEDILASIRRILSEDETPPSPAPDPVVAAPPAEEALSSSAADDDDVLVLDTSMLVQQPDAEPAADPMERPADPPPPAPRMAEPAADPRPNPFAAPLPRDPFPADPLAPDPLPPDPLPPDPLQGGLLAPEAAAAASTSVSHLVNTLTADRGTRVYHGGPTIEDLVREELRPLLKQWLDANLPPMVERLVRVEIERVVARVVP
jgi:cell pole-organizing protein PopZ